MEKYYFDEPQPRVTVGDGVVLLLINGKEMDVPVAREIDGAGVATTELATRKEWVYDGVRLKTGGMTSEAALTAAAQKMVLAEIDAYDDSSAVNSFYINGVRSWAKKDERMGFQQNIADKMALGFKEIIWWFDGVPITLPCEKAEQLRLQLENYAFDCFNVTAAHKKAVSEMSTVEEVLSYDYTKGYPEMLTMNI